MDYFIQLISKNWQRHGNYSGYEKIIPNLTINYKIVKYFSILFPIAKKLKSRTQLKNYSTVALSKELKILFKLPINKTIFILYGDMDYYYLHFLKRGILKLLNNQLIVTFHHPPQEIEKRLNYNRKLVLGSIDKIIVMGPNQIPFFKKYTNAAIKFIPHGIDTDYFKPLNNIKKNNEILIIGVSHRDHQRNITIIKMMNDCNITFKIVMPKESAKLYSNLKNVDIITERIDDKTLLNFYQSSKAILLSLVDCTASNTILEAIATGCPLVVNNVGAVKDYIPTESDIPVFKSNDIEDQVNYIRKIIEDEDFASSISKKQRILALNYDWKIISKITENFILN